MKKNLMISISFTLITTVLLGIGYPLVVTGLAQLMFPRQANGDLILANGKLNWIAPAGPAIHSGWILLLPTIGGRRGRIRSHCFGWIQSRSDE